MDIIIGSGVSGLSYAMFNSNDYIILEKDNLPGGYCKTTKRNGYVWDYSGHFFHFKDKKFKDIICNDISEDALKTVNKSTRIIYKQKYIDYPFQKNIHQLSKSEMIDCIYDLFNTQGNSYSNFLEMLYCKFGKSIAEKFLKPYNEKLYACDLNQLDKDAMGRFFPYAEKEEIIKNFKSTNNSSYNESFVYPKNGAIEYINAILNKIDTAKIKYNHNVVRIDLDEHKVHLDNGTTIEYDRLISTMPFPELLEKSNVQFDKDIYTWNKVLVFNLGFDKKGPNKKDHWLYFPEKKYSFYRVGFYDNILNQERMSLYVEIGFNKSEIIDPDKWLDRVIHDLRHAGIMSEDQELVDYETIIMDPAYVHINSESIKDVVNKKDYLKSKDVYSIGRYGSWTYCSIEDNIKEAFNLVSTLKNEE
jgi:protoporphyrinogen oxidase